MEDEYNEVMDSMRDSETFEELLKLHLDWIDGKIIGYSYNCYTLLDDLDDDKEFVDLLRYVSHKLNMVTTDSQSAIAENRNNIFNKIKTGMCYQKPYIEGYVSFDIFRKILEFNSDELMIVGCSSEDIFDKDYLDNNKLIKKDHIYIKENVCDKIRNVNEKCWVIPLTYANYIDDNNEKKCHVRSTLNEGFDIDCDYDDPKRDELYGVFIFHNNPEIGQKRFIELIKNMCDLVINK